MISKVLLTLSFSFLYLGASSQLAPVYQPGGAATPSTVSPVQSTATTTVRKRPKLFGGRRRLNRMVTETVYGFLEFTTTVGSTVMVFTPQSETEKKSSPSTKKVAVITATPTSNLVPKIETTKAPKIEERRVTSTSSSQSISSRRPAGLAGLLQRARSDGDSTSFSFPSKPLRNSYKSPDKKNREFLLPNDRKRDSSVGGSTIVPITLEGQGVILKSKTVVTEPSVYIPEEVVVTASQTFPPLSVISPVRSETSNEIDNSHQIDGSKSTSNIVIDSSLPSLQPATETKPTGLVTTLGGTIISDGQTTVHKTSVIGTYVSGKYAQVLKSTSKIFQDSPLENLITPIFKDYKTVKAVIEGSATKFFKPEPTATLPIESLFSSSADRAPRYDDGNEDITPSESRLTKRRGANPHIQDDYYYYYDSRDKVYEDEYDDLVRAGSGLRPSFRPSDPPKPVTTTTPIYRRPAPPTTFKPRFKLSGPTRNIPPSFLRKSPNKFRNQYQHGINRPKSKITRKPFIQKPQEENISDLSSTEQTVRVVSSTPSVGPTNVWYELITLKSLDTFRVGADINTRFVTYTRTLTHSIHPTSALVLSDSKNSAVYENPPLFENILEEKKSDIATLPPINLEGMDLNSLLKTTTETFRTTETMYKTSVLPVKQQAEMQYYTLTQTYLITRIVSAIKTIPPLEAFEFVPSDSFNEFNTKLVAEGTEHEEALLPGEREQDVNKEIRVPPPSGFKLPDANLADLVGGKFNPDALEKQTNPQLAAALDSLQNGKTPEVVGTKSPLDSFQNSATPGLTQEALQLAYLRLMNPYMFGAFPGAQNQQTVTSSPVVITTDVTTTSTKVLKVIFNARPILTTITSIGVARTTVTSYSTKTIASLPPVAGLPFVFPTPSPFAVG